MNMHEGDFDDDEPPRDPAIQGVLDAFRDAMMLAPNDAKRLQAITAFSRSLARYGDRGIEPRDRMTEIALNMYGLGVDDVQAASTKGAEAPFNERMSKARVKVNGPAEIIPFETFDAGDWEGVPTEPRCWLVRDRIPMGEPGIVSGDGGTGKTRLMLQLAASEAADQPDWVNGIIETHGTTVVYSAEEKLAEMHRRTADILAQRNLSFKDVKGRLHFVRDPDDVILARADRDGNVKPTLSLLRLEKTIALLRPVLVIIENAADVYAGDESNRTTVTRFVRKVLGGLCDLSGAAVALIQHPSVSGLTDGTGRSGSTGWNNAGRWRLNFTRPDRETGIRQLEVIKSNYGPDGEKVQMRWHNGVFIPLGSSSAIERAAAEAPIDQAFLACLDAATEQGVDVHVTTGKGYAPSRFAQMPQANGHSSKALEKAMQRLLDAKRIKNADYGPPSKIRKRLERRQQEEPTK